MLGMFRKDRKDRPVVTRRPTLENLEGRNLLSPYVYPAWMHQTYVYPTWMPQTYVYPTWMPRPYTAWR